jgi:hypothetical protein
MNTRALLEGEKSLIAQFADKLDSAEREQLRFDVARATAKIDVTDASRVMFDIAGYQRPPYRGQQPFGIEGTMLDSDNAEVSVLLHADENGRLFELEFIRWDSKHILGPQWNTLKLFKPNRRDQSETK